MTLQESWEKYVRPFIKEPGCISKDPVVAGIHLTNLEWMEAMGHWADSITASDYHVHRFEREVREKCAKIAESMTIHGHSVAAPLVAEIAKKIREG